MQKLKDFTLMELTNNPKTKYIPYEDLCAVVDFVFSKFLDSWEKLNISLDENQCRSILLNLEKSLQNNKLPEDSSFFLKTIFSKFPKLREEFSYLLN